MCLSKFVKKFSSIIRTPTAFFTAAKKEQGVKDAFIYDAILSLIPTILVAIGYGLFFAAGAPTDGTVPVAIYAILAVFATVGMYFLSLGSGFVSAGILHLFALLLGAEKGYANTYKAAIYGSSPWVLAVWLPMLGTPLFVPFIESFPGLILLVVSYIVFIIWTLYMIIRGISVLQEMSMWRAAGVILIPIAIAMAIAVAFALMAAIFFFPLVTSITPIPTSTI